MKPILFILLIWGTLRTSQVIAATLPAPDSSSELLSDRRIRNLTAFARLYGYIRYFHPSDEAAALKWDNFAVYGIRKVWDIDNDDSLVQVLKKLFTPFAPTVLIYTGPPDSACPDRRLSPPDTVHFHPVYWIHMGLGLEQKSIYKSIRVNRDPGSYPMLLSSQECMQQYLVSAVSCTVPMVVYGNSHHTWPVADTAALRDLSQQLDAYAPSTLTADSLFVRLGDVIIAWNVFRHFYPYWQDASLTSDELLNRWFRIAVASQGGFAFRKALLDMTSALNDGQIQVSFKQDSNWYTPPVWLARIDKQLIILKTPDPRISRLLSPGDSVQSISGKPADLYLDSMRSSLSSYVNDQTLSEVLCGPPGSTVTLTVIHEGKSQTVDLPRDMPYPYFLNSVHHPSRSTWLKPGIFYLNMEGNIWEFIQRSMSELVLAKDIICDLRGPSSTANALLLRHLLISKDQTQWMFVPEIAFPDYQRVLYMSYGWHLAPESPHIKARMLFLSDSTSMGAAESFLAYVKADKLGTIVGTASAGADGDINTLSLPGGYNISWTGMLVQNHDGSKSHLLGIQPDVSVHATLQEIRKGQDEILLKALELAR